MTEFTPWPKTPRLSKSLMVITEKIDGTNAAVGFEVDDTGQYRIYTQSRKRIITPTDDNFGFAAWAYEHQESLFHDLGFGLHFGEWWGSGIQRGYGLPKGEKRFSLFNTARFAEDRDDLSTPGLGVVPVLGMYTGFETIEAHEAMIRLRLRGSYAAPGFMNPEGICIFIREAGKVFKMTFEGDDHKWAA